MLKILNLALSLSLSIYCNKEGDHPAFFKANSYPRPFSRPIEIK